MENNCTSEMSFLGNIAVGEEIRTDVVFKGKDEGRSSYDSKEICKVNFFWLFPACMHATDDDIYSTSPCMYIHGSN